jgi:hypothetical protein
MQCPDCGYEVDDTAIFCPQCRFQFRKTDTLPVVDTPANNAKSDESFFEETQKAFSGKELRMLEVQLLQPAILVVFVISLCLYTVISTVPLIPITVAGQSYGMAGILCFACGLVTGILFFVFARSSLRKFRYR